MPNTPRSPQFVGQRIRRKEDERLIQGGGTYVDDIQLPGLLHLGFRRSDLAHARIIRIDTTKAAALPGIEAVFTGVDLRDLPSMPILTPFPAPNFFPLARDKVRYVGEPLAVVVASDRYIARDAIDAIEVELEELPAVVDPELALRGEPVILHEDYPNNLAIPVISSGTGVDPEADIVDDTAIDDAFAEAEIVVSQRMVSPRVAPSPLEPRGVVAQYNAGKDFLTLWISTQSAHVVRTLVAQELGLGENQIRVIAPEVGGGFGAKTNPYAEGYIAATLTRRLGRPVKWIEDRSEAFLTTSHGRGVIGYVDIAAKRDGTVLGLKLHLIADIGAYQGLFTAIVPTLTQGMMSGVYDIPAIRADLSEVFTNKTPTDPYRGAGRPEGIYFVERAMDMLARELSMDPAEVRRKNFIAPERFPIHTQAGATYDSGEYARLLDHALELSDWDGLKAERDAARADGRRLGVGMAYYVEVCGLGPSSDVSFGGWEHASVTVERDGVITATTGSSSHGQGHETTFAQLLADEFGTSLEAITIQHGDTAIVKQGIGTFGSRSQAVGGTALLLAAGKVKSHMARFAAQLMEAKVEDLVFADGAISVAGSRESRLTLAEVARYAYAPASLLPDLEPGLSDEAFWEPTGSTYPFGCYIALVEIDTDTGAIAILRFVGVDDCGTVVNPLIVEGQIHGGLAQGIGTALLEEIVYDENGQVLNGSLLDYALPRTTDFPTFELGSTVTPTPLNPLGAKGIGEAGTIGSAPCIVNAAIDALSDLGITHVDMALNSEKLWRVLQPPDGERS